MGQYLQTTLLILGLILINAFFAASEIAVISSNPVRRKRLTNKKSKSFQALNRLTEDQSRFLATIQVGITLAGFLASASAAVSISEDLSGLFMMLGVTRNWAKSLAVILVTALISYITLVLGELVPKRFALQKPDKIALLVARPIELVARLTGPFTTFLTKSTNIVVRMLGGSTDYEHEGITEEELLSYVKEHQELYAEEKKLIAGVVDFGDRLVRQLMVPRTEIVPLRWDMKLVEAIDKVRQAGYWNYPVYGEDSDDVVGVISVKDLLKHCDDCTPEAKISSIMRPAIFVPETKRALELLKEMHEQDRKMAVVVDEYGGVAGLVTLEDLLEEIVGDISERNHLENSKTRDDEIILDAGEPAEEIAEQLNLRLPDSHQYETLAGFILYTLGTIPEEGASVDVGNWRFIIEKVCERRVEKVKAVPLKGQKE